MHGDPLKIHFQLKPKQAYWYSKSLENSLSMSPEGTCFQQNINHRQLKIAANIYARIIAKQLFRDPWYNHCWSV